LRAAIGAIVVGLFMGTGSGCNAEQTASATIAMSVYLAPVQYTPGKNPAVSVPSTCSRQLAGDDRSVAASCQDGSRSYTWQRSQSTEIVTLLVAPI